MNQIHVARAASKSTSSTAAMPLRQLWRRPESDRQACWLHGESLPSNQARSCPNGAPPQWPSTIVSLDRHGSFTSIVLNARSRRAATAPIKSLRQPLSGNPGVSRLLRRLKRLNLSRERTLYGGAQGIFGSPWNWHLRHSESLWPIFKCN